MTGEDVVREAKALLGVPYRHQGRDPETGIDCVGLPVIIVRRLGGAVEDYTAYQMEPDGRTLLDYVRRNCDPVFNDMRLGDLLVFYFRRRRELPQHVGIVVQLDPPMFLHTHSGTGKVIEVDFDERWQRRLHSIHRLKGVA